LLAIFCILAYYIIYINIALQKKSNNIITCP